MRRASFTIKKKGGPSFDANHLAITVAHDGARGSYSVLSFVCSGEQMGIPADEVESVEFHPAGAGHCAACDQSIYALVGSGIHKNPGE